MLYYILIYILYNIYYIIIILYIFIYKYTYTHVYVRTRVALNNFVKLTCEALAELVIAFKTIIRGLEGPETSLGIPR
jgi:hypothetical protein